jgi:hypothetical protein
MIFILTICGILKSAKEGIPFTRRKKVSYMRGRKESLGSIKEGTRSKSRTVGQVMTKSSMKGAASTSGHLETGHGGLSHGSRKLTSRKGGTSK